LCIYLWNWHMLPLIRQLKKAFTSVEQPWYADDALAGAKFTRIWRHYNRLCEIGPDYRYYPESSKRILVMAKHNLERAKIYFADLKFKVTTGARYLGGFIREQSALKEWVEEKVQHWKGAVAELASAATKFPQAAYPGLQQSLQQEWEFMQRVVKDIGGNFPDAEKEMSQTFLPALFDDVISGDDPHLELACLPVKFAGLSLPDPVASADWNYQASVLSSTHILAAFRGVQEFSSANHSSSLREVRSEIKNCTSERHELFLADIVGRLQCDKQRTILCGRDTGQWLSVPPSTVNETELFAQEFRHSLLLR
jgi:hypothetical protein